MDTRKAKKLYEDFHEHQALHAVRISRRQLLPRPNTRALSILGFVRAISYDTSIGHTATNFKHTFKRGSRPYLATDGKKLFIVAGRFHVSARGIVDLSPAGRERE
jgi:hypothetical protein